MSGLGRDIVKTIPGLLLVILLAVAARYGDLYLKQSYQVLAAGFGYGEQAGLMGDIYNLGRVLLLPFVVLVTIIYVLNGSIELQGAVNVNKWQFIKDKFPAFIYSGLFRSGAFEYRRRNTMIWAFSLGFTSIGLTTRFSDLKAAGKDGLLLSFIVGTVKAVAALIVVLLLID
jgi:uncharacterized membrane protein YadS